ncbi:probable inactive receptor kinase RLK902 [Olea europaea var. sylvestris]|uniref:probable inactive receptor kinase RLK902 n=1 Tax=Olea europaea var. sylvestris TaxID=158386 RepID=UPI000C1CEF72|nr:probable inactive receptor kinase RLK902 [Olea europaea var. sylvestris]
MRQFNHHHGRLLHTAVLLLLFLIRPSTSDIASDRAALLALRAAVGGRILLWNISSPTPCSWAGVNCSPDNSSVIELRLPGMGLSGTLPANTISNLTNLQTLSLRYNALSGPLPADLFSSLLLLRSLYLHQNFFSGEIPDSLFSLKSLVRVNLAENNFSGPISSGFNNLTHLTTLYLQENHFSGSIPELNLPSLVQFNVSYNNLTGKIPKGLSRKPKSSFVGNSLCGDPLDNSCGSEKHKKKLSDAAIAGIVVGSVLGLVLILSLVFCLRRKLGTKGVGRKKEGASKEKEVEDSMEIQGKNSTRDKVKEKEKEKGEVSVINAGKKGLVFFGNMGWNFDLEDLLRASAEVLGKGTFGTAYKAVLETGLTVAVKRLRDVIMGEKEFREKMEEIGKINHENLVPLRAYYCNRNEKLLVFEYVPMGSLSALLHGNKGAGRTPLNWETRVAIALGAAEGVSFLHSQGPKISHGSIKSSNILLTRSYEARVSDFGLAQLAGLTSTPNRVSGYRAPEVTDPCEVSQKADVYSFGVLLLELLTGKAPTHEEGFNLPIWVESVVKDEWTAEVFDLELLRYQNIEEDMVQLLQLAVDCVAQYPDKRPSMAEVTSKIQEICRSSLHDPSGDIVNVVSALPTP